MRELTGEIARRLEAGEVLYVHCWGGRGRAGTVGACLLASLYGIDAEQALARVQRAYDTRGELGACLHPASLFHAALHAVVLGSEGSEYT